jgi:hypothetical protein
LRQGHWRLVEGRHDLLGKVRSTATGAVIDLATHEANLAVGGGVGTRIKSGHKRLGQTESPNEAEHLAAL